MESATCILWANHATGDCNIQIVVLLKMETGCRKGSICNVTFLMNIWMGEVGFWGMGGPLGGDHSSQIILFTEHSLSFLSGRFWPIPDIQEGVFRLGISNGLTGHFPFDSRTKILTTIQFLLLTKPKIQKYTKSMGCTFVDPFYFGYCNKIRRSKNWKWAMEQG